MKPDWNWLMNKRVSTVFCSTTFAKQHGIVQNLLYAKGFYIYVSDFEDEPKPCYISLYPNTKGYGYKRVPDVCLKYWIS